MVTALKYYGGVKNSIVELVKLDRGTMSKLEENCAQTERELKKVIKRTNDIFFNRIAEADLSISANELSYKNMPSFFLEAFEYSGNKKVIDLFYK